jgi:hypothetical protein
MGKRADHRSAGSFCGPLNVPTRLHLMKDDLQGVQLACTLALGHQSKMPIIELRVAGLLPQVSIVQEWLFYGFHWKLG